MFEHTHTHIHTYIHIHPPSSTDKRHHSRDPLLVLDIITLKEAHQIHLFLLDSSGEELPQDDRVCNEADGIAQDELGADTPPKEAEVRRVAQLGVDARGDEAVAVAPLLLHDVVEGLSGLDHGGAADELADRHQHEPQQEHEVGREVRRVRRPRRVPVREQQLREQALERRRRVRDGVRGPVRRQQERGHGRLRRVVPGGRPELKEVEGRERHREEGQAPEGRRRAEEHEHHDHGG